MGRRAVLVVATGAIALLGCRADTVTLGFEPTEGDTYRYRYEIEATVTRTVEGQAPEVTELVTELSSVQEVIERTEDGARVEVTLTSEGSAPRTAVVLLDRAGSLQAIQEIDGSSVESPGAPPVGALLAATATDPPDRPLAVGDRWRIADAAVTGDARLDRLGIVDGHEVAVVSASLVEVLADAVIVDGSDVVLDGDLRSTTSTTFDLVDGAVRRATSRSNGTVQVLVSPPAGVVVPPVAATITYELRVRTTQLD
jgi:hypothetical protein